ncbi:MAG: right-handed parallel beta-helix repeat-containing protein [Deltaproteobacteria bacterium]|nr:right-handed parallel beta-helix repeat-containing protein [Deltaproteobacteria bacterium]
MLLLIPAILILVLAVASSSHAARFYISLNGKSFNNGTKERPLASLEDAASKTSVNDTIIIEEGEYLIKKTVRFKGEGPLHIVPSPGDNVIIKYTGTDMYAIGFEGAKISIENLTIIRATNANGNIIGISGKDTRISNCKIFFDGNFQPSKYDCIKILNTGSGTIIENCEIYGAPNQGVDTVGASNLIIRNNIIHNCQNAVVLKGGSSNNIIENNVCYDFKHGAIGLGGYTSKEYLNRNYEIGYSVVRKNTIYYRAPQNIGGGIFLHGANNCEVYNNTIYGAGLYIRNGGDPDNPESKCFNNKIFNNIIWRTGNDGILRVDPGNEVGLELLNNIYWKTSGSGEFKIGNEWIDYEVFKKKVSYDHNSIFADPMLKDPDSADFSLNGGSVCIDRGVPIKGMNYSGESIDIGAHEYD